MKRLSSLFFLPVRCMLLIMVFGAFCVLPVWAECSAPVGLSVANRTTNSAVLVWALSDVSVAPQYDYVVSTVEFSTSAWSSLTAGTEGVVAYGAKVPLEVSQLALTGLQVNTDYYVLLRQNCEWDYNGVSEWQSCMFSTLCAPVQLPLDTAKFETQSVLPDCWTVGGGSLPVIQDVCRMGSEGYAVKLSSTAQASSMLYTPALAGPSLSSELVFKVYAPTTQRYFVGIAPLDGDISSDIVPVLEDNTLAETWTEVAVSDNVGYFTDGYVWVVYTEAGSASTVYVDDVWVHEKPACVRPADFRVSDVAATSAVFGWTEQGNANRWIIELIPSDGTPFEVNAATNPFTCTALQPQTGYTARIKSVCGTDGDSEFASVPVTFRTSCAAVDIPLVEDFDNCLTGTLPECWTAFGTDVSSDVSVQTNTSYAVSGSYLRMRSYASTAAPIYAVLPSLNTDLNQLHLTFTSCFESATVGTLEVGYLANPSDASSFVAVRQIPNSATKVSHDVYFSEVPSGIYMAAFRFNTTATYSYHDVGIDNVELKEMPSCRKPEAPVLAAVTAESVVFALSPAGDADVWEIVLSGDVSGKEEVTGSSFVLSALAPETAYNITLSVRSVCAVGDTSEVVTKAFAFTTPCVSVALPLDENFNEITSDIPSCWDNEEGTTTNASYRWSYNSGGYNGTACLRFNSSNNSSGYTNFLKTPAIELAQAARLSFRCKKPAAAGQMDVYLSLDGGATMADTLVAGLVADDWTLFEYDLSAYTGNTVTIVFKGTSNYSYYYMYLDDVLIESLTACQPPVKAWIETVTSSSALLKVKGATGSVQVEYGDGLQVAQAVTADTTDVWLTDLQSATAYTIKVRSACDNDNVSRWLDMSVSFTTSQVPVSLPYEADFSSLELAQWWLINGTETNHWTIGNYNSAPALYIAKDIDGTAGYKISTSTIAVWAVKTFTVAEDGQYNIRFDWLAEGESTYDYLSAFVVPASVELAAGNLSGVTYSSTPAGWIRLSGGKLNLQAILQTLDEDLTLSPGEYKLVFLWHNDSSGGSEPAAVISNVTISKLACDMPGKPVIASLSDVSAALSWTGTAEAYNVRLFTSPDYTDTSVPDSLIVNHKGRNLMLDNLRSDQVYYVSVQAACGEDVVSKWSEALMFKTYCSVAVLPYVDGVELDDTSLLGCWNINVQAGGAQPEATTTYKHTGNRSLACKKVVMTSRQFGFPEGRNLSEYQFSVYAMAQEAGQSFTIGVTTSPEETERYIQVGSASLSVAGQWQEFLFSFRPMAVLPDVADYKYIVLNFNAEATIYIDDLLVGEIPSCPKPSNITITNVEAASVTVDWLVNGTETAWQISLSSNGELLRTEQVSQHPYMLTGLSQLTDYSVGVQAVCDAEDVSEMLSAAFITPQTAVSLPYSCNFSSPEEAQWLLINGNETNHWTIGAYESVPALYIAKDADGTPGYQTSSASSVVWASKIFIADEDAMYNIRFDWQANGEGTYDYLSAFVVPVSVELTAGDLSGVSASAAPSGWKRLGGGKLNLQSTRQTCQEEIALSAGTYKLIFLWRNDYSAGSEPAAVVYNVSISKVLCESSFALQINDVQADAVTALINDSLAQHAQWEYVVSASEVDLEMATPVSVSSKTFMVAGLNPATSYTLYVRAVCSDAEKSDWRQISFETSCGEYVLPFEENFNDLAADIPLCWDNADGTTTSASYRWSYYNTGDNGTACLRFNSYSNSRDNTNFLKTPAIALTENARLSFRCKKPAAAGQMDVYLSVDGGTTMADTLQVALETADWTLFEYDLSAYTGFTVTVVFKAISNYGSGDAYMYLDNVFVESLQGCMSPAKAWAESVTSSSALLQVKGATGNVHVEYDEELHVTVPVTADTTDILLTGLSPLTAYEVKVRSVCAEGDSSRWLDVPLRFTTPQMSVLLPYESDFSSQELAQWLLVNGTETNHWTIGDYESFPALYIAKDAAATVGYNTSSASTVWAVKSFTVAEDGQYNIRFEWLANGEVTGYGVYDYLAAFVVPASVELKAGSLYGVSSSDTPSGWIRLGTYFAQQSVRQMFDDDLVLSAGEYKLIFLWCNDSSSGSNPAAVIFNVAVEQLACALSAPLRIVEFVEGGVTLVADNLPEDVSLEYVVGNQGFDPTTAVPVQLFGDTLRLSGLTALNTYDIAVRMQCTETVVSPWKTTTVKIPCIENLPFTETFDGLTSDIPSCWDNAAGTTTDVSYKWSRYNGGYDGSSCMRFNSYSNYRGNTNFLKTPAIELTENVYLSFMCKKTALAGQFDVYLSLDGGITMTDTLAAALVAEDWTMFTYDLSAYRGQTVTIVFKGTSNYSSYYMYLDNVSIKTLREPMQLAVTEAAVTTVNVSWLASEDAVAHQVKLSVEGQNDSLFMVNAAGKDMQILIEDLQPSTNYMLSVRSVFAENDSSEWVGPVAFTTLQSLVTDYPYLQNFENETENANWSLVGTTGNQWIISGADPGAVYEGQKALYISDNNADNQYSIGSAAIVYAYRSFALEARTYQLSYQWHCYGEQSYSTYYDYLSVFLVPADVSLQAGVYSGTSTAAPKGWKAIGTLVHALESDWQTADDIFEVEQAGSYNLVFMWKNDNSGGAQPPAAIDNLVLQPVLCSAKAERLTFNATGEYCDFAWNTDADGLQIKLDTESGVVFNTNPLLELAVTDTMGYRFENLQPQTTYYLAVRTMCVLPDTVAYGQWQTASFTTECAVNTLPYEELFEENVFNQSCWTRYSGLFTSDVATADLNSSYSWTHVTTGYGIADNHMKLNIYGESCKAWMVSPSLVLTGTGNVLMFDLALTKYNSANPIEDSTAQQDDRFVVAVSTDNGQTWSLDNAMEWNNTGSANVYNAIPSTATTIVMPLDDYTGNTVKLAFYGESTAAGGDNDIHVGNIRVSPCQMVTLKDSVCAHTNYVTSGFNISADRLTPGKMHMFTQYMETTTGNFLYTLELYVYADGNVVVYDTICPNVPYSKYGMEIPNPVTRTYISPAGTLFTKDGCDSIITLHLFVPQTEFEQTLTVCENDMPYQFGTQTITQSGTFVETFAGALCDSTVTLHLTVLPTATELQRSICSGDSLFFGNSWFKQQGDYQYTFKNILDCDSVVTLHLEVLQPVYRDYEAYFCEGSVYTDERFAGLSEPGLYTDTLVSAIGCDSIIRLTLMQSPRQELRLEETICSGEIYLFDGKSLSTEGEYIGRFINGFGCDSVVTLALSVLPTAETEQTLTLTTDQLPYVFAQTADSVYVIEELPAGIYWPVVEMKGAADNGCDSIVNLTLTINEPDALDYVEHAELRIVPNIIPVGGTVYIYTDFADTDVVTVELFSAVGQRVSRQTASGKRIQLDGFRSGGLYLVKLVDAQERTYVGHVVVK